MEPVPAIMQMHYWDHMYIEDHAIDSSSHASHGCRRAVTVFQLLGVYYQECSQAHFAGPQRQQGADERISRSHRGPQFLGYMVRTMQGRASSSGADGGTLCRPEGCVCAGVDR